MCGRWCSTRAHESLCFPWGAPEAGATVPVTWETPHVPTLPHSGLFPAGRAGPRCTPRARVPPGSVPAPPLGDRGPPPTALRVGDVRPHDRGQGRMALPKGHSPARVGFPSGPQGPHPIKSFLHTRFLSILPGQTRSGCQRASPTLPRTSQPHADASHTQARVCKHTRVPPSTAHQAADGAPAAPGARDGGRGRGNGGPGPCPPGGSAAAAWAGAARGWGCSAGRGSGCTAVC